MKYTENHDWVRIEGRTVTVGVTDFAQKQLGDIVFVELPDPGEEYSQGEEIVVIESVKSVSDVEAPIGGVVTEVNESLEGEPEKINESPFESGWLVKLDMKDETELESLMDESEYEDLKEEA
ncbi:glycine cleavage system protein GcvH [Candidatus Bipolaricaulota bacterium]|nr:glycine cleavage system protein GcvH [Candidatus Bipolaricaulota bacterium]MBS3791120.1 glycine cleavage system protein GcvH [Candidatus Bipolaricaulota bacterium]